MNLSGRILIVSAVMLAFVSMISAQNKWTVEMYGGIAGNVPMPLQVEQTGHPDLYFTAKYESLSLANPIYYGFRIGKWLDNKSWELEFTHHKLYLSNNPPEIDYFSISHGLNMFTLNRGVALSGFQFRGGAGPVIFHPEFKIRNVSYDPDGGLFHMGYLMNGVVLNVGVGHPIKLSNRFFFNLEVKTTFAYVRIQQDDLKVNAYNWAFHLILGPGYSF